MNDPSPSPGTILAATLEIAMPQNGVPISTAPAVAMLGRDGEILGYRILKK